MVDYTPRMGPVLDFSGLFKSFSPEARMEQDRIRILKEIGQQYEGGMPDPKALGAALLSIGDVKGAMTAAQLARTQADSDWQRTYQTRSLDLQEKAQRKPQIIGSAETGYHIYDPSNPNFAGRGAQGAGGPTRMIVPPKSKPVSASDEKVGREAETALPGLNSGIRQLEQAENLTEQGYSGSLASQRAWAGKNLPDWLVPDQVADPKKALATEKWENIMGPQAIESMSSALSGATTNFELQEFKKTMADPNISLDVKKDKIREMMRKAREQQEIVQRRAQEYKDRGAARNTTSAPVTAAPEGPDPRTQPQYEEGKRFRSKSTGKIYVIRNGVPVEEPVQ